MFLEKLKLYWKWIVTLVLLAVLAVAYIFFKKESQDRMDLLLEQINDYKAQIDLLNKSREEERKRQEEIDKRYQETLKTINEARTQGLERLNTEQKKEIKAIVEQTHDNPELLANRVNSFLGIPVYNANNTNNSHQ